MFLWDEALSYSGRNSPTGAPWGRLSGVFSPCDGWISLPVSGAAFPSTGLFQSNWLWKIAPTEFLSRVSHSLCLVWLHPWQPGAAFIYSGRNLESLWNISLCVYKCLCKSEVRTCGSVNTDPAAALPCARAAGARKTPAARLSLGKRDSKRARFGYF